MLFAILQRTYSWLLSLYTEVEIARCIADMRGDTDTTELMQIAVELKMTWAHFEACLLPSIRLVLHKSRVMQNKTI